MARGSSNREAGIAPESVLGRVVLITGKEEFLRARVVSDVRQRVREADAEAEFSDATAATLTNATLGELAAPSLFSTVRCVVVTELEDLPDESVAGLVDYAAAPAEDVAIVLAHSGGQKGSGVLTKLRKCAGVDEVKVAEVSPRDLPDFVSAQLRSQGRTLRPGAAATLIDAVGSDLRSLSAAAVQLCSDFPEGAITEEHVKTYFGGRAEAKSFAIADAAFNGRREAALRELRWAMGTGTAAVLVTSAFAGSARSLARMRAARPGASEQQLAKDLGVPPWKVKQVRKQAASWSDAGLARAIRMVAETDAAVKGAGGDPSYAMERLVLSIAALRAG